MGGGMAQYPDRAESTREKKEHWGRKPEGYTPKRRNEAGRKEKRKQVSCEKC